MSVDLYLHALQSALRLNLQGLQHCNATANCVATKPVQSGCLADYHSHPCIKQCPQIPQNDSCKPLYTRALTRFLPEGRGSSSTAGWCYAHDAEYYGAGDGGYGGFAAGGAHDAGSLCGQDCWGLCQHGSIRPPHQDQGCACPGESLSSTH